MTGGLGLALLAGLLSTLAPCVLPLLPIVVGAAATEHRLGPAALALGLCLSFVTVGLFVATIGFSLGLDGGVFRPLAALGLAAVGIVLLVPGLQSRLSAAAGPFAGFVGRHAGDAPSRGLGGQFVVGLLLGAIWAPCVGPTLGAAVLLAAQGRNLGEVALTMALFGIGAALPLVLVGLLSREILRRWRGRMLAAGAGFRMALGAILLVTGGLILSGLDRRIETALVDASPDWLTALSVRF